MVPKLLLNGTGVSRIASLTLNDQSERIFTMSTISWLDEMLVSDTPFLQSPRPSYRNIFLLVAVCICHWYCFIYTGVHNPQCTLILWPILILNCNVWRFNCTCSMTRLWHQASDTDDKPSMTENWLFLFVLEAIIFRNADQVQVWFPMQNIISMKDKIESRRHLPLSSHCAQQSVWYTWHELNKDSLMPQTQSI